MIGLDVVAATPAAPAFTLGVSPVSQTVVPGSPTSYAVTITRTGGFTDPVTLSVTGLPAGATGNFNTNPATISSTLVVTPSGGTPSGAYTLTVSGVSGTLAHSSPPFGLNVAAAPNTAPTLSDLGAQTVNEDTATGPIPFTVGDVETAAGSLTVSGTSTNTTLVPNGNIVFGGSGANRTVSITPAANQTGTATITVTVSDGTLTTVDPFLLTVTAVNDAPTIAGVGAQTVNEDTATAPIPFTVGDAETPVASLTLSGSSSNPALVPASNIVFGGSGANRTVTVTPAANQTGTATITVTVSDGTADGDRHIPADSDGGQ